MQRSFTAFIYCRIRIVDDQRVARGSVASSRLLIKGHTHRFPLSQVRYEAHTMRTIKPNQTTESNYRTNSI